MRPGQHRNRAKTPRIQAFSATLLLFIALFSAATLTPTTAQARHGLRLVEDGRGLLHTYSATMGLIVNRSGDFDLWATKNPIRMNAMGVRYYERNGFITGTILALGRIFAAAAAASGPKSSTSYTRGNYRYTETTYYSAAEKRAMSDASSNSAAQMLTAPGQSFDIEIYSRNVGGDSTGYRVTMMMGGWKMFGNGARAKGLLDVGLSFGSVKSAAMRDGKYLITQWSSFGIPIRMTYAIGPINIYGLFDWNWFGHTRGAGSRGKKVGANTKEAAIAGFPLRLGVTTTILRRLYLEAAATTPSPTSGVVGFIASAGARF